MPGRVSGRSARSSAATVARKSSTQTLRSRGSASARTSAHAAEVPDEGPTTSLRTRICQIFGDAQRSNATHRKLVINLRKIQEACCYEPVNVKKKQREELKELDEFGEEEFNEEIGRCALRVLSVKKTESVGDRIVRFLGLFLKHASEKDNALVQSEDPDATDALPETPSSRLVSHLVSLILGFLTAKDKTVRFRATQIIAHMVNTFDSIDDELFQLIRLGLLKRIRDKEPAVRVQAILGLGRLADENIEDEDEDSDDDAAGGILVKLLDLMQNDPSAEVRRSLLMNLPFAPSTLGYLLERARDSDPATRRALYSKLLPALGDFRHMSLIQREKLLRWGLRDRDEIVRKASARLFRERWIEDCVGSHNPASEVEEGEKQPGQVAGPNLDALLELLERIDVERSGVEDGMAHEAMREFWDGRPDYREFITFDDDFWNDLTPESAFVARSFNDYCRSTGDDRLQEMAEYKMPEVTRFSFFVQKHLNVLIEDVRKIALLEEEDREAEEEEAAQEFCVEQLLHIALTLDYSDEVGRRQMFSIMREALALAELPEECTKLAVEVLRTVCGSREAGEREFCGVLLEAVAEVHDTIMGEEPPEQNVDDSFHSAKSELSDESTIKIKPKAQQGKSKEDESERDEDKAVREVLVNTKCLHIAQCMLQNVHCDLEQNSALVTMLNTLIVPAVRSHEALIRERGLICLGLCSLLSKNLASSNIDLFVHCFTNGHEALQIIAIQVLADIVITHPSLLASPAADADNTTTEATPQISPLLKNLTKAFLKALASPSAFLSLMSCIASSKLLLLNLLPPASATSLLKNFASTYFNPETASNPSLRQALSYFLPVFSHSRLKNALLMAQVAVPVITKLILMREELDEEEEHMVGWPIVAGHFAEWTDGRKVPDLGAPSIDGKEKFVEGAEEPHIVLAIEVLERALSNACSKDERKPLLMLLSKLYISPSAPGNGETVDVESLKTLHALVTEAVEVQIALDATSRNCLSKLEIALTKRLGEVEHVVQTTELPDSTETEVVEGVKTPEEGQKGEEGESLLENLQAEGTVFPGADEEDDSLESTIMVKTRDGGEVGFTEESIVEQLLASEMEE
ncbi:hypothetical protein K469DRAFT_715970 [Zopfia rhizophila CBS 207.26]|uniref:Nuclear condensin complex subunit 3 C-terminal domain-containing protein n=1 Tax=Zopfia rhizophila CBS 207.26 TaxID=1314779 RepID=A0A6A6DPL9_9PEZI|nr:hypothetical protein K469DRAFT_715970 [Zopfia rhizophila CBS 207.26]